MWDLMTEEYKMYCIYSRDSSCLLHTQVQVSEVFSFVELEALFFKREYLTGFMK